MLEFAGRIRFGVDVGDFLELERAFQRDRVVQAAAEEQRVLLARECVGPGDDLRLERQHAPARATGRWRSVFRCAASCFGVEAAAQLGQRQRQQEQRGQLRGERLGRGDADLGAGARQ